MGDNAPMTIAATLQRVVEGREYRRTAMQAAVEAYGPSAVSRSLNDLLQQVRGMN
jgi:hypothetical protein